MIDGVSMTNFFSYSICVAVAVSAVLGVACSADAEELAFRTPSNNIHCQVEPPFEAGQPTMLRCDVMQRDNADPPMPADCDADWGTAFYVTDRDEPGARMCAGDTVKGTAPVLQYGSTWSGADFECLSETSGLKCQNGSGHGFALSRRVQKLF
ncbi:exported protein of unknown function [Hyphomicrobium sp. 1Nfss2.1]